MKRIPEKKEKISKRVSYLSILLKTNKNQSKI